MQISKTTPVTKPILKMNPEKNILRETPSRSNCSRDENDQGIIFWFQRYMYCNFVPRCFNFVFILVFFLTGKNDKEEVNSFENKM